MSAAVYDVAVLGAGVVGCALAYELSKYELAIVVIDKNHDVGEGTSKGNSAIIHTGFDATPGSMESKLVVEASRSWPDLASKLKVPFRRTAALVLALDEEQAHKLPSLYEKAVANDVGDTRLMSADEVRALEPSCNPSLRGALYVPRESIVDPFGVSIAYAEVALANGAKILLGSEINNIDASGTIKTVAVADPVTSSSNVIRCRHIVNCGGLGGKALSQMYGGFDYDINPRRGQFVIYDKFSARLTSTILLPIPTAKTKGMLVTPSIFGNLIAGPTAEDLPYEAQQATGTTHDGIREVQAAGRRLVPQLEYEPAIGTYAGLRCNCAQGSYLIRFNDRYRGVVTVAGMRSTGLTSSFAVARYIANGLAAECGLVLREKGDAHEGRPEGAWPGWWRRPFDDPARLGANPDYGRILCYCEQVSKGEIVDALRLPLAVCTLDAIKRRTRAMAGRCQAFNCLVPIAEVVSAETGIPLHRITKKGPGSEIIA